MWRVAKLGRIKLLTYGATQGLAGGTAHMWRDVGMGDESCSHVVPCSKSNAGRVCWWWCVVLGVNGGIVGGVA